MKVTPLALLTVFAATSSAFGLNGAAQSITKSTRAVGFAKPSTLVQPVDIQGNRLNTLVSHILDLFVVTFHVLVCSEKILLTERSW